MVAATGPAATRPLSERDLDVDGVHVHLVEAPREAGEPILYLHGNPTAGWLWEPFLERTGGVAPDLPGFGRSSLPGDFEPTLEGYARFLQSLADALVPERFALVVHDIGAIAGLVMAQRMPERITRLVVMNHAPLLPGYRWHKGARLWRRPLVGELAMRFVFTRRGVHRVLFSREGEALPSAFLDRVRAALDEREKRAILALYRSMSESDLADAGRDLGAIKAPALVVWATDDPYIPARFGADYARALGGETTLEVVDGAGHWMWLERPDVVDRVAAWLG